MSLQGRSENSRRREHQVDGRGHQREGQRDGGARRDGAQGALAAAGHLQRPGDHGAECEQADAAIIASSSAHREPTRLGVAALSPSDGITNCGGGPGLGPTANVNAPRTGCPSAEITRHHTRYQPCGMRCSGTKIVFGSSAVRAGLPAICCLPAASVTDMTAKRGSMCSL